MMPAKLESGAKKCDICRHGRAPRPNTHLEPRHDGRSPSPSGNATVQLEPRAHVGGDGARGSDGDAQGGHDPECHVDALGAHGVVGHAHPPTRVPFLGMLDHQELVSGRHSRILDNGAQIFAVVRAEPPREVKSR